MVDPAALKGVPEGSQHVLLPYDLLKFMRTVFSCKNLIAH